MTCFPFEDYPYEKDCPICGREFFPTVEWGYKRGTAEFPIYICSYPCCREYDRREALKREHEYKVLLALFNSIYDEMRCGAVITTKHVTSEGFETFGIGKNKVASHWKRFAKERWIVKTKHGFKWVGNDKKEGYDYDY